jgi:hypothetical protein
MNIGNAQIGIVFAIDFFDQFFKALYREGILPNQTETTVPGPTGDLLATTRLDPPTFEMATDATYTRYRLTGEVELRPVTDPTGAPVLVLPLDTSVRLSLVVFEIPNAAPVIGLEYEGVDEPPAAPLTAAMVDQIFTTDPVATMLADFEVDTVAPVIDALEDLLSGDGTPPARDAWDIDIQLLPGAGAAWDAVCVYVALPGTLASLGDDSSFLPSLTEFGLVYSRQLLDSVFATAATEQVGTDANGATITRMSLVMDDTVLLIDGAAERDAATVTFAGPVELSLIRGTDVFAVDTSNVDVSVDVPWYVDVLLFFTGPIGGLLTFGLGALIGEGIFAATGTSSGEVRSGIDAAPGLVRGALAGTLTTELEVLAEAVEVEGDFGGVEAMSTPDHSVTEDGAIGVYAQVIVNPFEDRIVAGQHSSRLDRFVEFGLGGGRRFSSEELARFVEAEMITTPGYHDVHRMRGGERRYMRADPDETLGNNLLERFED